MVIASSMRGLAQGIASSREDRVNTVGKIKEEAKQVRGEAQALIKGFRTSRHEEGARLRKELAQSVVERKSEVNGILKDAHQTVGSFRSSRKEMGTELRRGLAESRSTNKSEVEGLLKKTENLVRDLGRSRKETSEELRKDLNQCRTDRESEVKEMRSDFRKSEAEVRTDLKEAAAAWQQLTRTTKAGVKVQPTKEKVEVPKEEIPDPEVKLLAAIREHPNGISLVEVAESLRVVPVVLGHASKRLLDEGKIRREDKLYFPVTSG